MKRIRDTFLEELSKASENYKVQTGEAEQTDNKYSIENIDRYTEKQYNNYGWIVVNDVLNATEHGSLMHQFDDFKNRNYKYPVTKSGEALIITFDAEHNATKLVSIKGTTLNPIITAVIEPIYSRDNNNYYLEVLSEDGKKVFENRSAYAFLQGEELFRYISREDYPPFGELKRQRRSSERSRKNSKSLLDGRRGGRENTEAEYLNDKPSSNDGGFSIPGNDSEGKALSSGQREYFKESKVRNEDGNLLVVYHRTGEAKQTENKYSIEDIDNNAEKLYNKIGDENERTEDFRRLQSESKGLSEKDSSLFRSGDRRIDGGLRARFERIFTNELLSGSNGTSNGDGLLRLYSKKNTEFRMYQNLDPALFHDIFEVIKPYLYNGELVDLHPVNTNDDMTGYRDMDCYISENGLSGFAITKDKDLVSVFNIDSKRGFIEAIAPIVRERAITLDCYNSHLQPLMEMYQSKFGFKPASIMAYNIKYDHDGIAEKHGMPDVAFMVNVDAPVETRYFTKDEYDAASEYQKSFFKTKNDKEKPSSNDGGFSIPGNDSEGKALSSGQREYFKE